MFMPVSGNLYAHINRSYAKYYRIALFWPTVHMYKNTFVYAHVKAIYIFDFYKSSFKYACIKAWNTLTNSLKAITCTKSFAHSIKKHISFS